MAYKQTATRCYIPAATTGYGIVAMVRTFHFVRGAVTSIRVGTPNWYVPVALDSVETNGGGSLTVTGSIEYPAGTFTQLLFGGSVTGTCADGATLLSDALTIAIPDGAKFYVRRFITAASSLVYSDDGSGTTGDVTNGDAIVLGGSDQTMSGTIVDGGTGLFCPPICIIGEACPKSSAAFVGDSRDAGLWDHTNINTSGDRGELARPLGSQIGYICLGVSTDQAHNFTASHAHRLEMAQYCTHVILNYGPNDIENRGLAQTETDIVAAANVFGSQPVWTATITPRTYGPWTAVDGSDQTLSDYSADHISLNNWLRTVPAPFAGCFEVADQLEISHNSGLWRADGTAAKYTPDGLHETSFGNASLVLDASVLAPGATTTAVLAGGGFKTMVDGAQILIGGQWNPITQVQISIGGQWRNLVP
jgi:hypothetical protein